MKWRFAPNGAWRTDDFTDDSVNNSDSVKSLGKLSKITHIEADSEAIARMKQSRIDIVGEKRALDVDPESVFDIKIVKI